MHTRIADRVTWSRVSILIQMLGQTPRIGCAFDLTLYRVPRVRGLREFRERRSDSLIVQPR